MHSLSKLAICLLVVFAVGTALAGANTLNGAVYQNIIDPNDANDPANWNTAGPYATFLTTAINFDSRVTGYTPTAFLNGPVFTGFNSFDPNADLNNTEVVITGLQFLQSGPNYFYVTHDDGVYIELPGVSFTFDQPGPTSPITEYFTVNNPGAAGLYAFTLNYAECCGAPAVLVSNLGSVPEPGTLALVGSGALGLAGLLRRKLGL
jgi:hypothetical protein